MNLNASYDPSTKEINAQEGTIEYFHELRHKEQHECGWFDYEPFLTLLVVISVLLKTWVLAAPFAVYLIIIESDATIYALLRRIYERQGGRF